MMETRKVNYKSDFVLRETFRDGTGKKVKLPDIDFVLKYWVKPEHVYEASRKGNVFTNCKPDGDSIVVIFKDHNLGEGELRHELYLQLDNILFADGVQNVYYPETMQIYLWDGMGNTDGTIESDCVAAYTRGYPFTFEDFTPAQIAILQKPATDAAQQADAATDAAKTATQQADAATDAAKTATQHADAATNAAKTATQQADAATDAAKTATQHADAATDAAKTATQQADAATDAAKTATQQAITAKNDAQLAADNAGTAAQKIEQTRSELTSVIARAENVVSGVPTGLIVTYPPSVTIGNPVKQYVKAAVKPDGVQQNVVYQTDGASLLVEPDGEILARNAGTSRVHVIPTQGTQYYKTIEIEAIDKRMRMAGSNIRLDKNGNIRLT